MTVKLATLKGAIRLVKAQCEASVGLEAFGITPDDYQLIAGNRPWLSSERPRVDSVLDNLCAGSLDQVGVGRFDYPAEWIAGILCSFVDPVNIMVACKWCERTRSAEDWSGSGPSEEVTPSQLYALCLEFLGDTDANGFRDKFEKKIGVQIRRSQIDEGEVDGARDSKASK